LAVPAVAESHPDGLLIELGRQFDRVVELHHQYMRRIMLDARSEDDLRMRGGLPMDVRVTGQYGAGG
jgi:hypothetical protein